MKKLINDPQNVPREFLAGAQESAWSFVANWLPILWRRRFCSVWAWKSSASARL